MKSLSFLVPGTTFSTSEGPWGHRLEIWSILGSPVGGPGKCPFSPGRFRRGKQWVFALSQVFNERSERTIKIDEAFRSVFSLIFCPPKRQSTSIVAYGRCRMTIFGTKTEVTLG